jgi:hypothetical protein
MDYAILDATITNLNKKPPLWITRYRLIKELEDKSAQWISLQFSGTSREFVYHDVRKNKEEYDYLSASPFWNYRMADRYDYWTGRTDTYNDINEKVRYEYHLALKEPNSCFGNIYMSDDLLNKNKYETRISMWREAKRETALELYGKISDDILREIVAFC